MLGILITDKPHNWSMATTVAGYSDPKWVFYKPEQFGVVY